MKASQLSLMTIAQNRTFEFGFRLMLISILACVCPAELMASPFGPLLNNDLLISGPTTPSPSRERAKVAFDGDRYLVVWSESTDTTSLSQGVYGQFIDRLGALSGPRFPVVSRPGWRGLPAVAFNGSHYLVVWGDSGSGPLPSLRARVVSTSGVLLGSEIVLFVGSFDAPAIASDGIGFLVVWNTIGNVFSGTTADVQGRLLTVDGSGNASLVGPTMEIAATMEEEQHANVAFGQTQYLVTWDNGNLAPQVNLYGKLVTPGGMLLPTVVIKPGFQEGREAGIAFGLDSFLVVYNDFYGNILGTRVTETGTVVDAIPIAISPSGGGGLWPKIAFDGTNWVVVWSFPHTLGARVSTAGTVLDTPPFACFVTGTSQFDADLASDRTNFLVTWSSVDDFAKYVQLVGPRFANLSISKSAAPDTISVGENLTYTLTVNNSGPSAATGITVTDTLPAGVTFVTASTSHGFCSGTVPVNCSLGSLANGASATVTIVVKPTTAGIISNTASVTAAETDSDLANNTATAQTTVSANQLYNTCLLYESTKAVHSGASLPIKLQLCDGNGHNLSSSGIAITAVSTTQVSNSISRPVQSSGNANLDGKFRFDATLGTTGGYIFHLSTKGLPTGTYRLNFTVTGDSFLYSVPFQVK